MLNKTDLVRVVARTLNAFGEKEVSALTKLIIGTFLMESGLNRLSDYSQNWDKRRGFALMADSETRETIYEQVRWDKYLQYGLASVAGWEISPKMNPRDIDGLFEDMESNIALMVAVLYIYYRSKYVSPPKDNNKSAAETYVTYYASDVDTDTAQKFINTYTSYINED